MAHGKRLAGRAEAWLMGSRKSWGTGQYHEGRQRGKQSLRFLPFIPLGISKPKPATYLKTERKKKEKKKKSTYGVIDNYKKWKNTHTQK